MKRPLSIFLVLLSAILLTGCWQEDDLEQVEDTQLPQIQELEEEPSTITPRVILPEEFSLPYAPELTLDPVTCPDGIQQVVASLLCESLFRLTPELEAEPYLCQSYTYDASTFTYVFTLQSGVTFSDGSALTAGDVKATLERARASERYGSRLSEVLSITVGEGGTVSVTLSGPNTGFPALLDIPIVKAGTESHPVGTGPYLLTWEQSGAYLAANSSWWQGDGQPTDRIALVEAGDQDAMLYRFTSHDVQLITADLISANPITATGSVSYIDVNTTILHYIGCNIRRAPLDNAAFRSALSQGIYRESLVSAYLSGHGIATQFPVSPVSSLYPKTLESDYRFDSFQSAVTESGYTPNHTLTLLVNEENPFKVSVAQRIAENFAAAGISIQVQALPWEEFTVALSAGEFDLYYGEIKLTADWDLSPLLSTFGTLNYGGWSNAATEQLLSQLAVAENRKAAMEQLCSHLRTEAPILPICFKSTSVLMQTDVLEGLIPTAAEPFYNLTDCAIHLRTE